MRFESAAIKNKMEEIRKSDEAKWNSPSRKNALTKAAKKQLRREQKSVQRKQQRVKQQARVAHAKKFPPRPPMLTGHVNYKEYITSETWTGVRKWIIAIRGKKCEKCPNTRWLQVHHLTYERLGRETKEDLQVLCPACHEHTHQTDIANRAHLASI